MREGHIIPPSLPTEGMSDGVDIRHLIDLSEDGTWLAVMPFVHFTVSDFKPVQNEGAQNTDALSFAQPAPFHEGDNSRV